MVWNFRYNASRTYRGFCRFCTLRLFGPTGISENVCIFWIRRKLTSKLRELQLSVSSEIFLFSRQSVKDAKLVLDRFFGFTKKFFSILNQSVFTEISQPLSLRTTRRLTAISTFTTRISKQRLERRRWRDASPSKSSIFSTMGFFVLSAQSRAVHSECFSNLVEPCTVWS